jgi:hypothetical protein
MLMRHTHYHPIQFVAPGLGDLVVIAIAFVF